MTARIRDCQKIKDVRRAKSGRGRLSEAIHKFLPYCKAKKTRDSYASSLGIFREHLGYDPELSEVNPSDILVFRDRSKDRGLSNTTVNNQLKAISSLYRWAMDFGHVEKSPVIPRRHYLPPEEPRKPHIFTPKEYQALVKACDGERIRFLRTQARTRLMLGYDLGLRSGEIRAITVADVHEAIETGELHVHGKGHQERDVPLSGKHIEQIHRQLAFSMMMPAKWLLCSQTGGQISHDKAHYQWKRLLKRAELPNARFHDLRYTFIYRLIRAQVDVLVIAKLVGHTNLNTTLHYLREYAATKEKKKAMEKLGEEK